MHMRSLSIFFFGFLKVNLSYVLLFIILLFYDYLSHKDIKNIIIVLVSHENIKNESLVSSNI